MQILNIVLLVLSVILAILGLIVSTGMNRILVSVVKGYNQYMNLKAYYLFLSISTIIFFVLTYLKVDALDTVLVYFLTCMMSFILGSWTKIQDLSAEPTELLKIRRMESLETVYILIPVLLPVFIFQNYWVAFILFIVGSLVLIFKNLVFIDEYESEYTSIQYRFFYTTLLLHLFLLSAVFNLATNSEYYKIIKLIQFGCVHFIQVNTLLTMIFIRKQKSKIKKFGNNSNDIQQ